MRIRILDPHWEKMDPDPGHKQFFTDFLAEEEFLSYFFSLFL